MGGKGHFFFFSTSRLSTIANEVLARRDSTAPLDFFHGFTPWIHTSPQCYMAWSDATFHDYIEIYHPSDQFRTEDLRRIEELEAGWLRKAERVLFTNRWAADRAIEQYSLDPNRVATVGIFGEIEMPETDMYAGSKEFAFIATDFERKGGRVVVDAIRRVRMNHPDASLVVVGEKKSDLASEPGVTFVGYLSKEKPDEFRAYRDILRRARAVVNATRSDISPLLPIEAGYFGCPAISSRRYAIPELIDDRRSGLLLNNPSSTEELADAMSSILDQNDQYMAMRRAAWKKTREEHSKARFEERLAAEVADVLAAVQRRTAS
jgi:glycosyltransferase involved in cell wall biosynthesis